MENIKYILKSKFLVTKAEKEQLDWLHYSDGYMFPALNKKNKLGMVVLAKKNNLVISWGLLFERYEKLTLFIYTRKDYRRLGLGSKIYKIMCQNFGSNMEVSRHNIQAAEFYDSLNAK